LKGPLLFFTLAPVKKRRFLIVLSSAVAGLVSLPYLKPLVYDLGERFVPRMPGSPELGTLSPTEMDTVLAYAEVLSDITDFSEETRQYMGNHIQARTQKDAGYFSLFRMTATFLNQMKKGEFSKLSRLDRVSALQKHGLMSCRVHRRECFSLFGRSERTIRALAAADLVSAYYRSPAGWAVVGYAYPRGYCADLTRYTRPEA
jgi:hypothetical protein